MSGKPAGPAADPAVAVVGSLNMDLVIRVPELPRPGETAPGRALLASLQADGVDRSRVRVVGGVPSGTAFITVSEDGENQIVLGPGANSHLTGADVAAQRAVRVAAAACLRQGAQASLPTPSELDTLSEPSPP
jgi:ribokinase